MRIVEVSIRCMELEYLMSEFKSFVKKFSARRTRRNWELAIDDFVSECWVECNQRLDKTMMLAVDSKFIEIAQHNSIVVCQRTAIDVFHRVATDALSKYKSSDRITTATVLSLVNDSVNSLKVNLVGTYLSDRRTLQ